MRNLTRKALYVLLSAVALLALTGVANWAKTMFPAGTVAAPGLSIQTDTNTGLYAYASDVLGFAGGGAVSATLTPGTLALKKTTTTNLITSDSAAGTTDTSIAALTLKATENITDGDLLLGVQNSAAGIAFKVDEQGACTALTTLNATTDINLAGADLTSSMTTQSFNIKSATADGTTDSSATAAITMKATADIGNADWVLDVQPSTTTHLFTVNEAGLCTALTDVAAAGNNFMCTGTATCQLDSAADDNATSGTAGAFTLKPSVNVTDGDLILDVENSATNHLLTVTEQGATVALTTVKGTTGVIAGTSGTTITTSLGAGSVTYDCASVAANDCVDSAEQVKAGTAVGDTCTIGPNATAGALDITWSCYVGSAGKFTIKACNPTAGAIDPASGAFYVRTFSEQ